MWTPLRPKNWWFIEAICLRASLHILQKHTIISHNVASICDALHKPNTASLNVSMVHQLRYNADAFVTDHGGTFKKQLHLRFSTPLEPNFSYNLAESQPNFGSTPTVFGVPYMFGSKHVGQLKFRAKFQIPSVCRSKSLG